MNKTVRLFSHLCMVTLLVTINQTEALLMLKQAISRLWHFLLSTSSICGRHIASERSPGLDAPGDTHAWRLQLQLVQSMPMWDSV